VLVERALELRVHPLEALLGELEAAGVLVQALEQRAEGGLGVGAAGQAAHAQVGLGAAAERARRAAEAGLGAERVPARADELGGQRPVAVEDRTGTRLLDDVVGQLGAGVDGGGEERGGLEREVTQRVVQLAVAHGGVVRRPGARSSRSCRAR
jgi:hypothetical protein